MLFLLGMSGVVMSGCASPGDLNGAVNTGMGPHTDPPPAYQKSGMGLAAPENPTRRDLDSSAPSAIASPAHSIIGHSVEGRPIELYSFGTGEHPVLVMGAIHGDETSSADVSRGLLADLQGNPPLAQGVPVAIIPIANPDGFAAGTRTNAHHVDLNRNFPASNYSARAPGRVRNNNPGKESASEPETLALMEAIQQLQPRLIITVHSMNKPSNNYDGPAASIAELMSRCNGYPATATIGYPTPGSLGTWAGVDRQIPIITLELPRRLAASRAWGNNRSAVLGAIGGMK
jgi:protein MpaA